MSVERLTGRAEYTLLCDHPECTKNVGAAANSADGALSLLYERALERGWGLGLDGKHWCCDHKRPLT